MSIRRRRFLASLGLGAGSLMLPSLWRGSARAGGAPRPPKRLVLFTTVHGPHGGHWHMRRDGLPDGAPWEFDLDDPDPSSWSEVLEPLHAVRDQLLVLEGLSNAACLNSTLEQYHQTSRVTLLTNEHWIPGPDGKPVGGGQSVDQLIAAAVARPDQIPSLEYGTHDFGARSMSYRESGLFVPIETDPAAAFERLFPPDQGVPQTEAEVLTSIPSRRSVLDRVAGEYSAMADLLGAEDRAKLELHREMIRELEQRLTPMDCGEGVMPTGTALEQFFALTTVALSCDATRVVTIQAGELASEEFGYPAGMDVHNEFAHHGGPDNPGGIAMAAYYRRHAEQFRDLVLALQAVPEDDGTLLDNTIVCWLPELGNGNHDVHGQPAILAGGGNASLRTGRYVHWPADRTNPSVTPSDYNQNWGDPVGPPVAHLLVSLAQAMDVPVDTVGLTSVTGNNGVAVDLSGPLDRLT